MSPPKKPAAAKPPEPAPLAPTPVKSADIKPANDPPPKDFNTVGKVVPQTEPAPQGMMSKLWDGYIARRNRILAEQNAKTPEQKLNDLFDLLPSRAAMKGIKAGAKQPTAPVTTPPKTGTAPAAPAAPATPAAPAAGNATIAPAQGKGGGYSLGKANVETGRCAEWLAKRDYEDKGYETMSLQNASGQGVDLIARAPDGSITHVEVKGTTTDKAPGLSGKGKMGGEKFLVDVKRRMNNGTDADKAQLEKLKKWEKDANGKPAKYNKREVFVDDQGKGCMDKAGKPQQDKPWTPTKTRGPKK